MDEALKQYPFCPFCGGVALMNWKLQIVCTVCGATVSKDGGNYEEIIRMWNKRVDTKLYEL